MNGVEPDIDVRHALERLWSAPPVPGTETTAAPAGVRRVRDRSARRPQVPQGQGVHDRNPGLPGPCTLNVKQLTKCCVLEITPGGWLILFADRNSVGYREQVSEQLSGVVVRILHGSLQEGQVEGVRSA